MARPAEKFTNILDIVDGCFCAPLNAGATKNIMSIKIPALLLLIS